MNQLSKSNSPYLLQHAHNPVNWYPWEETTLALAKKENKLLVISVGYAACHWCHVMERESFEDEEVAGVMNADFISIKVDREERPDIDQVYMDAVSIMTGQGGWPLNIISLPDGRPVWGGTYFPKAKWIYALTQLADLWKNDPPRMEEYARNLMEGLEKMEGPSAGNPEIPSQDEITSVSFSWAEQFDKQFGGPDRVPKFPMPSNLLFLLRQAKFSGEESLWQPVETTLLHMALGGIYDQAGGGFCRYATDRYWVIPHFEKMLYDNAQLVSLYSEAYQHKPDPVYKQVVGDTIDFVLRELTSPGGGFYSSLDADSEGVEGKFYTWEQQELEKLLGADAGWYCEYFNVKPGGNWEHRNILHITKPLAELSARLGIEEWETRVKIQQMHAILLNERKSRIRPGLDDKVLLSWNALMICGLLDAATVFENEDWKNAAIQNAEFLLKEFKNENGFFRSWRLGKANVNAFLDDYAALALAFLQLYQSTSQVRWLKEAEKILSFIDQYFSDPQSDLYFYTSSADDALITRKKETQDNVTPSSNSMTALACFTFAKISGKDAPLEKAEKMLAEMAAMFRQYPSSHSFWGLLWQKISYPFYEIVTTGPKAAQYDSQLQRLTPDSNHIHLFSTQSETELASLFDQRFKSGVTQIFICREKECKIPVTSVEEAIQLMKNENQSQ